MLPDHRRLAYTEYGDPQGHPTLYFHGFPGSRLEAVLAIASAANAGVRLIAADRPGIGGSDLGVSQQSTFAHAFRRWTGSVPSGYRPLAHLPSR